jgi:hypothetical protein
VTCGGFLGPLHIHKYIKQHGEDTRFLALIICQFNSKSVSSMQFAKVKFSAVANADLTGFFPMEKNKGPKWCQSLGFL